MKKGQKEQVSSVVIKRTMNKLSITIDYSGEIIKRKKKNTGAVSFDLSIFERAELMGGYLQIKNAAYGLSRIKLITPIN